jgi:uncharacterized membrane protein
MEIVSTAYGWEFLIRFVHYFAGITWLGILFYLNFIQAPFLTTELGVRTRGDLIRGLQPGTVGWMSAAAMVTLVSGWLLIGMYLGHGKMSPADGLMTRILTGGVLGSVMWWNAWFIIRPAQKMEIESEEQVARGGQALPALAASVARASLASRTNVLFAIPLLFFMGSARHLHTWGGGENDVVYWILVLVLIALLEVNCLVGSGRGRQRFLGNVVATIHMGLALTLVLYLIGAIVNSSA